MQCQGPGCTKHVQQKEGGHRARKYCSDACRVAAHRAAARTEEAERVNDDALRAAAEKEAEKARERQEIRNRFPMLTDASIDLLLYAKQNYGLHAVSAIGATLVRENETSGEGQAKYKSLLADFMQAGKKMGFLERQIRKYERLELTNTRASMLQELMVLGGRLKYASLTNLGIDAGIDQWLNYARGASDSDMAAAIAHGYYQADTLAMAAIEANDLHIGMQMRQRIDELERTASLQRERIDELEQGQGENIDEAEVLSQEQVQALVYHARERALTIEQQAQQVTEQESKIQELITKIHRLEEAHNTTMYRMNHLLAVAQTAQPLQSEAEAGRVAELEREIQHLHTRISKQYVKKSDVKLDKEELEQARSTLLQLRKESAQSDEQIHQWVERCRDLKMHYETAQERIQALEANERQLSWEVKEAKAAREWTEIQARYKAAQAETHTSPSLTAAVGEEQ